MLLIYSFNKILGDTISRFTAEQAQNALNHYWLNKDWSKVHFLVKVTPKKKKVGSLSFRNPDNVLTRVDPAS
jgi:hypothetical protein